MERFRPKGVLLILLVQSRLRATGTKSSAPTHAHTASVRTVRSQPARQEQKELYIRSVAREQPKFCWMANPIKLKGAICCGGGVFLNALWLKWLAYLSVKIRAVGANERRPCVVPRAALARSLAFKLNTTNDFGHRGL
jgi:hypothetical protein